MNKLVQSVIFLSQGSNNAGKNRSTYLQPHFYIKYKQKMKI